MGIDQNVDLKALRALQRQGLIELHQANELEQTFRHVAQQKKAFIWGFSKWDGPDVFADDKVHGVERIVGLNKRIDIAHIYACYLNKCAYFVTEDADAFIYNGRREALDSLLGVKIRRTAEFIQEITPSSR